MAMTRIVLVDEEGRVRHPEGERLIGRTVQERRPLTRESEQQDESLEVRDAGNRLVGWVRPLPGGGGFALEPNHFFRAVELDEFERLVNRLAAAQSHEALFEATAAGSQLTNVHDALEPEDQRRLAALMGRFTDLLSDRLEALDALLGESGFADDGFGTIGGVTPTPVLFTEGGLTLTNPPVTTSPTTGPTPGSKQVITPEQGQRLARALGLRGARLAGLGAFGIGGATLVAQGYVFYLVTAAAAAKGLLAAFRVIIRVYRTRLEGLIRAYEAIHGADLAEYLAEIGGAGTGRECFDELLKRLDEALKRVDDLIAQKKLDGDGASSVLAGFLRAAFRAFGDCLIRIGMPPEIARIAELDIGRFLIFGTVLEEFGRLVELLTSGSLAAVPSNDPDLRNGLRDLARVARERNDGRPGRPYGYHRKGGFAYDEFDDDRAEAPDISGENPRQPVDPTDVEVIASLDLSAFSCADLFDRLRALKAWLATLAATRDFLVSQIRDLTGEDERAQRQTAVDSLNETKREIRKIATALQNTLAAMARRPCPQLNEQELRAELASVRETLRETLALPDFRE